MEVALDRFATRLCTTWSCPNEALDGGDLCAFCADAAEREGRDVDLRAEIMGLIVLLGRVELEAERNPQSLDYRLAVSRLRHSLRRAAQAARTL